MRYPKRYVTRRRDASIVNFMLNTGLRLGETISLTLGDVEISERKGHALVRHGKGNKERVVPLNSDARDVVTEWLKVRPASSSQILWLPVESCADEGLTSRAVQRVLKRYGQDAGIENLTPHVLRHSFAKNLANKGVGVEKIAMLLGHENLNTTQIYIKPDFKDLEKVLEEWMNTNRNAADWESAAHERGGTWTMMCKYFSTDFPCILFCEDFSYSPWSMRFFSNTKDIFRWFFSAWMNADFSTDTSVKIREICVIRVQKELEKSLRGGSYCRGVVC